MGLLTTSDSNATVPNADLVGTVCFGMCSIS
jgi:hypothetical protein